MGHHRETQTTRRIVVEFLLRRDGMLLLESTRWGIDLCYPGPGAHRNMIDTTISFSQWWSMAFLNNTGLLCFQSCGFKIETSGCSDKPIASSVRAKC